MSIKINENERFDLIQKNGLGIIQNSKWFSYGIDAVLLSNFAEIKKGSKVIDFGCGTGIIPILLSIKNKASKIYGIEKQQSVYEMAKRSIEYNKLDDIIELKHVDISNIGEHFQKSSIDVIVSNPPYFQKGGALINDGSIKATSRHETTCTLEDFIMRASVLLKEKGSFYMVHRPMRAVDIFYYCRKYKLEPKLVQFIYPNRKKPPNILLIKCVKSGNSELKYLDNLYVYDEKGNYTDELIDVYRKLNIDVFLEEHDSGAR